MLLDDVFNIRSELRRPTLDRGEEAGQKASGCAAVGPEARASVRCGLLWGQTWFPLGSDLVANRQVRRNNSLNLRTHLVRSNTPILRCLGGGACIFSRNTETASVRRAIWAN